MRTIHCFHIAWPGNLAGRAALPVQELHMRCLDYTRFALLREHNGVMTGPAHAAFRDGWSSWQQSFLLAPLWGCFAED